MSHDAAGHAAPPQVPQPRSAEPRDAGLAQLVLTAVRAANDRVKELETAGRYLGSHFNHPHKIGRSEHGWPDVSHTIGTGPVDYTAPFTFRGGDRSIAFRDVPELAALIDHVFAEPALRLQIADGHPPLAEDADYVTFRAALLALSLLDRARHLHGADPTDAQLLQLYMEREPTLIGGDLPVEIIVPILLVKFDGLGRTPLGPNAFLEHLDDDTHRARSVPRQFPVEINPFLADCATHALVLTGYELPRAYRWQSNRLDFWPVDDIDTFFRALEIVHDVPTGYAQLLARPCGWSDRWSVDLPPIIRGATPRHYPPSFEEGAWRTPGVHYPGGAMLDVATTYVTLSRAAAPIKMAARRLGRASRRERDDDTIVDLCIGLEALFGERGPEVSHKIAMRTAAAVIATRRDVGVTGGDILRAIKKIYEYRSTVVHGGADAAAKRQFTASDGAVHDKLALARALLRHAISATLETPAWTTPGELENYLLARLAETTES